MIPSTHIATQLPVLAALQLTETARSWLIAIFSVAVIGIVVFNFITRKIGAAVGALLIGMILGIFVYNATALEEASKKICNDSRTDLGITESTCGRRRCSDHARDHPVNDHGGRAPVWTSLWKVKEDFSGYGDVRLPWALQLDAAIGALVFAGIYWWTFSRLAIAGRLTGFIGGTPGAIVALILIFGAPFAVYKFLDSTHHDGRGRMRRAIEIAETALRRDAYPPDRLGRRATRPVASRAAGDGHHHRWRNP